MPDYLPRDMMLTQPTQQTYDAWYFMGVARFGRQFSDWRFVCPKCAHEFSARDAASVGIKEDLQGRVCPVQLGGCGYPHELGLSRLYNRTLYGLIRVVKDGMPGGGYFPFADPDHPQPHPKGGNTDGTDA